MAILPLGYGHLNPLLSEIEHKTGRDSWGDPVKKFLVAAAAAVAVIHGAPVFAADMPVKVPVSPFNWTGWYIGLNEGGALDKSKIADPFIDPILLTGPVFGDRVRSSGSFIGGQLG
jgi:hypothetical protein